MDCLFCKIVSGAIPATTIYEDEQAIAFRDLHPQAPVHVLVVHKHHLASLNQLGAAEADQELLLGHLLVVANQVAATEKLDNGYRTVINTGADGGQTVAHLHVHVLGGRAMAWPPG